VPTRVPGLRREERIVIVHATDLVSGHRYRRGGGDCDPGVADERRGHTQQLSARPSAGASQSARLASRGRVQAPPQELRPRPGVGRPALH